MLSEVGNQECGLHGSKAAATLPLLNGIENSAERLIWEAFQSHWVQIWPDG